MKKPNRELPGWANVCVAGKCQECGKLCYLNRKDARKACKASFPGQTVSAYPCGRYWHVGHTPRKIVTEGREAYRLGAKSA